MTNATRASLAFYIARMGDFYARHRLAQQAEAGITVHQVDVDSDDPAEVGKRLAELAE